MPGSNNNTSFVSPFGSGGYVQGLGAGVSFGTTAPTSSGSTGSYSNGFSATLFYQGSAGVGASIGYTVSYIDGEFTAGVAPTVGLATPTGIPGAAIAALYNLENGSVTLSVGGGITDLAEGGGYLEFPSWEDMKNWYDQEFPDMPPLPDSPPLDQIPDDLPPLNPDIPPLDPDHDSPISRLPRPKPKPSKNPLDPDHDLPDPNMPLPKPKPPMPPGKDKDDQNDPMKPPPRDPLVLDLDGDGVELISAKDSQAYFDLNGDGIREKVAWVSPDDAILVHDKNGNGQIDGISEVFGNGQRDGFEELADYDSNKDRIIDAKDAKFSELRLWQDKNGNGSVEAGAFIAYPQKRAHHYH